MKKYDAIMDLVFILLMAAFVGRIMNDAGEYRWFMLGATIYMGTMGIHRKLNKILDKLENKDD